MQCPFPGMDPYIERPTIWADFHDAFVAEIRGLLQPLLRPKYAALMQDRLYVVQSRRPIYPDVAVVKARSRRRDAGAAVAVIDQPMIFETVEEEIREPYVEIIEPAAGNRLITAIEMLSPDNKAPGPGRRKYLRKRRELRRGRVNLVEIDLLRAGRPTLRLSAADFLELPPWRYLAAVTRRPNRQEVFAIPLERRLPTIGIPLAKKDDDVPLDLQAVFTLAWQKGPYPALLRYDQPPPGDLSAAERKWCQEQLRKAL